MNYYQPNWHNKKEVVINQFFGLGDLLFIEPIFRHYHNLGYQVYVPVNDEYYWLMHYIKYVHFRKKSEFPYSYETVEQPDDGRLHIPLRFAHPLLRGHDLHYGDDRENWMRDKYLFLGLPENLWRMMTFVRNAEKEKQLFDQLGIKEEGNYNFINENWGGTFEKVPINPDNGLQDIRMRHIPGFTMLDWLMVIELARNVYTVETSIMYLIEALTLNVYDQLHLYPRYPALDNVNYIKSYMQKNWVFHDSSEFR